MIIHGREIKFLRTVQAACDIADICPKGDMANIADLFKGTTKTRITNMANIICFLNEGYEEAKAFEEEGYKPNPITVKEVMLLDEETFNSLFVEATEAFYADKQTVEVEPEKKKEKAKAETLD